MDSDSEVPNNDKIAEMKAEDYLKRIEEQSQKSSATIWNDKMGPEMVIKFPSDPTIYAQNIEKIFELHKKFIQKHLKFADSADDFQDAITGSTQFDSIHSYCAHSAKPKEQNQLSEQIIKFIEFCASETCEEGTVGGALVEAQFTLLVSFYNPLTKKEILKQCIKPIKDVFQNSKGKLSQTTITNIQTVVQYISMNAKSVMNDNAEDIYMIGINGNQVELILGLGQVAKKCSGKFPETCEKFMELYENMDSTQRSQIGLFIEEMSNVCPDKMIVGLSSLVEDLEQMNKYYSAIAIKNLCQKYADKVYEYKSEIHELCADDAMGYTGIDILGNVGKYTSSIDTAKECADKIFEYEQSGKCSQPYFIGAALKAIASGSEDKKQLLKNDYKTQIDKALKNKDTQLVEQINQLNDYLNDRNLENVENKIEDMKKEILDYVNSRMEDIKKNYNQSVKSLPMPVDIEVKKSIMNTIFLKFECAYHKDEDCEYPGHNVEEGEYFKTKTKEVNKWVKVGASVFSMGKSVLGGDVGGALGSLADTFSAAKQDDQGANHFKALMEEPFLTSAESDRLILQLREANYFNYFSFQAEFNGWVCYKCKPFERKEEQKQKKGCACNIF